MKQLALKRFMNTFYGETGNSLSPFFAVEIAGGVTTNGQESIRLVKKYVEERGYRVLYGDTDSLYICSPESIFKELDEAYLNGSISKTDYWKGMIELTMEDLDKFKDEVNNMLYLDNGTRFLKMAYEEVLWPFASKFSDMYARMHIARVHEIKVPVYQRIRD
jgi:DNA polymerase elongation subunit (family B)